MSNEDIFGEEHLVKVDKVFIFCTYYGILNAFICLLALVYLILILFGL